MADIVFRYPEMRQAANNIRSIATKYQTTADSFESDFLAAIKEWEGESKDAMQHFITVPVKEYIHDTVPALLNALAELLDGNANQMENADQQIADNIPKSLG